MLQLPRVHVLPIYFIYFSFCILFYILQENRTIEKQYINIRNTDPPKILYKIQPQFIEDILESTRDKIKFQLGGYNFTASGAHDLEDLVMEAGGRPLQSLIISTWRSGSTFLAQLLNAVPGTFYHYEPLIMYGIIQIRETPEADKALNTIRSMLKCNFYDLTDYFNYSSQRLHIYSHNSRLWMHCKFMNQLCNNAEFTSRFCKLFPFQTMKVVRLRLRLVQELLDDKELNFKVILLIRDPRGVMNSRYQRSFCEGLSDCSEPSHLCADMVSDYGAARQIMHQYPGRLRVLRFEDLALKPYNTAHELLKFLKIDDVPSIDSFLLSHTNVHLTETRFTSTFRVSRDVPFMWKNELNFNHVDKIQMVCKEAMLLWGYQVAHNETHMKNEDFNPIL